MANTTIGAVTIQGDGYSFIATNGARKESVLAPMPLYLLDSDETDVFDYGGVIKSLNFDGVFVGDTIAECKTFIDNCEALIQGAQDVSNGYPLDLVDDYRGTIKVKIMEFSSDNVAGEKTIIRWSFKLVQSSTRA